MTGEYEIGFWGVVLYVAAVFVFLGFAVGRITAFYQMRSQFLELSKQLCGIRLLIESHEK